MKFSSDFVLLNFPSSGVQVLVFYSAKITTLHSGL